ncbi:hypothetical protein K0M31_016048 [Melipona bicolor]|uniref:Uncharacterized protein n=1 Tax=Melipona bicolor TaxID=60889 RepID=A0AA40G683_9HYME|nr:hypothetical protein K0M31_016048 [Melipona bicolor]
MVQWTVVLLDNLLGYTGLHRVCKPATNGSVRIIEASPSRATPMRFTTNKQPTILGFRGNSSPCKQMFRDNPTCAICKSAQPIRCSNVATSLVYCETSTSLASNPARGKRINQACRHIRINDPSITRGTVR